MDGIFNLDWGEIFLPQAPILEIVIRGTVVYLALFIILRGVLKREAGTFSINDLLVVVLLADAVQNAMADDYNSVADGIILVFTIVSWSYFLSWLGYHFPRIQRFVHPPKLLLAENGKMNRRNMRRELISEEELMSKLREQGFDALSQVDKVYMEGDGEISVISKDRTQHPPNKSKL